jgi:hypothetical protein
MRLTLREGPGYEALPAQIVMKRIEHSRKHGPFDPRWLTVRPLEEVEQLEEAPPTAITPAALQAWEAEGGAVLPEERRTNPKTPAGVSAHRLRASAVPSGVRVSSG